MKEKQKEKKREVGGERELKERKQKRNVRKRKKEKQRKEQKDIETSF